MSDPTKLDDIPEVTRIIIKPNKDAPPMMVYQEIIVRVSPCRANVAAAFGDGILGDLDFGKHMHVDAVDL